MYSYCWDPESGGIILNSTPSQMSREPRPVYYKELDILGFDKYWKYEKDDSAPFMWAEGNSYYYRGRLVAQTKGGAPFIKPEIIIIDLPEKNGMPLKQVDIPLMVSKNTDILDKLEAETIKKIYNTFLKYRKKVDIFYVAFSGGKDSVLVFDLVQRALPHNDFKVLFGDTQMEFDDTYELIDKVRKYCDDNKIEFLHAKSEKSPEYTWRLFGPPAQRLRWCCSVHKTTPQIILLRKILQNNQFRGMAFTGIRAAESASRSEYEEVSLGEKIRGQYSFHPILEWGTAELFLYTYRYNLLFNNAYKRGNTRAGCLVCPLAGYKNMYIKEQLYGNSTHKFNQIILETSAKHFVDKNSELEYMNIAGWKARRSGRELINSKLLMQESEKNGVLEIAIPINSSWKEWIKTVAKYDFLDNNRVRLFVNENAYILSSIISENQEIFNIKIGNSKDEIKLKKSLKIALRKAAYCIKCQVCQANCPYGFIIMDRNGVSIDDKCYKCHKCHDIDDGCLMANSNRLPQKENKMGSVNRYANLGVEFGWIKQFFNRQEDFWENHELGANKIKALNSFLSDALIVEKKSITPFGKLIAKLGCDNAVAWGLIVENLVYSAQFNWWVKSVSFDIDYTPEMIKSMLENETKNVQTHVVSAFKNIFISNKILGKELGLGLCDWNLKNDKRHLNSIRRIAWNDPDSRVILYGLYKFAEACDRYYQFTLTDLLNDSIDRDGISPTRIFGLKRDEMINILNGLSINYSEFISVSFTLDLDNINLREDKSSDDILNLF